MTKITFKKRTGKDLFEFMASSIIDTKTALDAVVKKFVLIDDEPITLKDILNLNDESYIIISNRIFVMNHPQDVIYQDNEGVHWNGVVIRKKKLKRDFITQLQTTGKNNNGIDVLKHTICSVFDVSENYLLTESYELTAYLVGKTNNFLNEITSTRDEFELADIWCESTKKVNSGKLDNLV